MKYKRGQFSLVSEQAKAELEKWTTENLGANVVAVMTVRQRVSGWHYSTGMLAIAKGDEQQYFKLSRIFMDRVTKAVYKNRSKRYKQKIPYLVTLEGGEDGEHWHLNFSIQKPDHIEFEAFKLLMEEIWVSLDWAKPDTWIEELEANFVGYSLKRGPEAFLDAVVTDVDSVGFPRKRKRKHKGKQTGGEQNDVSSLAPLLPNQQSKLNITKSKEYIMSNRMNFKKAITNPNGYESIVDDRDLGRKSKHVPAKGSNGIIYDEEAKIKFCKEHGLPYVSNDTKMGVVKDEPSERSLPNLDMGDDN